MGRVGESDPSDAPKRDPEPLPAAGGAGEAAVKGGLPGDLSFHPVSCRLWMVSCGHGALTRHIHVRMPPPCRPEHKAKPQDDASWKFHKSPRTDSDLCQPKIWLMKFLTSLS